ncbi:helix-turn-helix domain-containing protein [Microbacterium sp. NPDC087665]|uniref:helix-turn-helix domain-containing protein n=1 Tax=Microbacterium sp. NPDC087665 TaxID=3364194 RepID=UPI0037F2B065
MTILDNPTWTLVDRLRKSRMLADLDQGEIADRIGVARNTVSNWERGRSEPTATYFVRWASATGVTLDWLAAGLNAETAPTEVETVSGSVRPKGLEPLTF